jgi:1-phosphofructokinase
MIYTVTINPAIDYVIHLNGDLKLGSVNRNASEDYQFGGKGINVSNVLKTLGLDTVALGFVAGFTGDGLENGLRDMGLKTDFVHVKDGMTRVNVKVKAAQETEINGIGPNITPEDMEKLYAQLDKLEAGDTLILSGSIPKCLPSDTYEKIMARLDGRGIQIAVDAERDLLVNVLKYHPFLIKPNNHELGEIFGKVLKSDEEIVECAVKLQEQGGRNILVSMAGDGALLLDEQGNAHRIGCPKGKVINSVGAGDSMVAGFVAGYQKTGDYGYALKLGTATGSATAFSLGLAAKEDVDALLATL